MIKLIIALEKPGRFRDLYLDECEPRAEGSMASRYFTREESELSTKLNTSALCVVPLLPLPS
jgi:hypothetical protein